MQPGVVSTPSLDIEIIFFKTLDYLIDHAYLLGVGANKVFSSLVVISIPLCVMLIIGTIYAVERLKMIRKKEEEIYNAEVVPAYDESAKGNPELSTRWKKVLEHVDSANQNDWRQAIIEADIILDEILTTMGYQGEGIGEKLKQVEKADFQSLDQAWEAHKVRNVIAHEGSEYALSQHEAKRIISLYRQVFEEFFYI